jgi:predicted TIM-barrel fold metal-dependent hydrolase
MMIIDTHFHAFPGRFLELTGSSRGDPRGVGFHAFDHQTYLGVMDQYGVDIGVLSNPGGQLEHGGDRQKALELCRIVNNAYAEAHAKYPHRFKFFARPPMLHMDDCVAELRRCADDLGADGVVLPTNLAGKYLDEPAFQPFWDEVDRMGKPLFLHPANAPCQSNWDKYSMHQRMFWPADSTLVLSRIVYSGIFDRYPNLKLIGAHLGGMVLNYFDRLNWWEGNPECREEPEAYFRKIYYDTAGPVRAPFIKMACETVGVDQILFGADYPHGRGGRDDQFYPMTLQAMEELQLSDADKQKIYYQNAKRIFGFEDG